MLGFTASPLEEGRHRRQRRARVRHPGQPDLQARGPVPCAQINICLVRASSGPVRTRACVPPNVRPSRHTRICQATALDTHFSSCPGETLHCAVSPALLIPRPVSNKNFAAVVSLVCTTFSYLRQEILCCKIRNRSKWVSQKGKKDERNTRKTQIHQIFIPQI